MANVTGNNSPFDRLPEPWRTWTMAARNSSELEGIPCTETEEEAVQATEKFIASGEPERIARITKLAQEAERRGESFYAVFKAEDLKTRPPRE